MAVTLKSAGLMLDMQTANAHFGGWIEKVARTRIYGTTGEPPAHRLREERKVPAPQVLTPAHIVHRR